MKVITNQAVANLQPSQRRADHGRGEAPAGVLKHNGPDCRTVETILNRGMDSTGRHRQKSLLRPLWMASTQAAAWEKEMAKVFKDIVNRPAASEKARITIFRIPDTARWGIMTREQLVG